MPSAQCCPVSGAVCPVPCAQCRVPNAQCAPMPNAQLIAPRCGAVRWGARGARPGACHPYECETADLCDGRARVAAVRLSLPASRLKKAARAACLAVSPAAWGRGGRQPTHLRCAPNRTPKRVSCLGSPSVSVLFDRNIHRAMLQTHTASHWLCKRAPTALPLWRPGARATPDRHTGRHTEPHKGSRQKHTRSRVPPARRAVYAHEREFGA